MFIPKGFSANSCVVSRFSHARSIVVLCKVDVNKHGKIFAYLEYVCVFYISGHIKIFNNDYNVAVGSNVMVQYGQELCGLQTLI